MSGHGSYSGLGNGGGSSKGLPEEISSTLMDKKIDGNVVTYKNGQKVTVNDYKEITDKALLNKAKSLGIEDPVLSGRGVMQRAVAEKAIEQGKQERANYKANMEKNVKGYDELSAEISKHHSEYQKQKESIERGGMFYKAKETRINELSKKYPRAAAYIKAEGYNNSSNYMKSAFGKEAMKKIRMGEPYKKTIETMERKWREYALKSTD